MTSPVLGALFNPAALSYPEALYLDPRFQSMMRSNQHAALYSQLASPYASHLFGMMPGAPPPNLSGLHERMKLEEDHRNRIAREEEKARIAREEEKARERDREMREKEMREREQREKEMREREQREKEMREREQREKEMREREMREKEHREREMRDKEMREREKQMMQQHYMQSQRNPYNLLGLFPQMVGLRPPSSMHPGYQMHHSLMGLPLPSQIPTSLPSSLTMQHHQSRSGSPSAPITSPPNMSMMPQLSAMGMNHSGHGLPHGLSLYPGNLPPPAHLYSPLPPPSASPSSLSNSSYNHPMMNPRSSPQPMSRRSPSTNSSQSLNLSKNQISSSSQYPTKPIDSRNTSDHKNSNTNSSSSGPSIATVSVSSIMNDKNFKIEIPNISNGNNVAKDLKINEAKDLSAVKVEKAKDEKLSLADDLKPVILEKPSSDTGNALEHESLKEDKVERIKEENSKSKVENQPQDFATTKDFESKEIKEETEDKPLSSNDNKTIELEKATAENLGANDNAADVKEEDEKQPSIVDEACDEKNDSTKTNETTKASNKK